MRRQLFWSSDATLDYLSENSSPSDATLDFLSEVSSPKYATTDHFSLDCVEHILKAVEQRLSSGLDLDAIVNVREGDKTPLRIAVEAKHTELTSVLLNHSANPNVCDDSGVYPLHRAVFDGQDALVQLLLEAKADANVQDCHGQPPVFFATSKPVCQRLLDSRCDVNVRNHEGQSALHLASVGGFEDCIEWLAKSVSPEVLDARDRHGNLASYYAFHSKPSFGKRPPKDGRAAQKIRQRQERERDIEKLYSCTSTHKQISERDEAIAMARVLRLDAIEEFLELEFDESLSELDRLFHVVDEDATTEMSEAELEAQVAKLTAENAELQVLLIQPEVLEPNFHGTLDPVVEANTNTCSTEEPSMKGLSTTMSTLEMSTMDSLNDSFLTMANLSGTFSALESLSETELQIINQTAGHSGTSVSAQEAQEQTTDLDLAPSAQETAVDATALALQNKVTVSALQNRVDSDSLAKPDAPEPPKVGANTLPVAAQPEIEILPFDQSTADSGATGSPRQTEIKTTALALQSKVIALALQRLTAPALEKKDTYDVTPIGSDSILKTNTMSCSSQQTQIKTAAVALQSKVIALALQRIQATEALVDSDSFARAGALELQKTEAEGGSTTEGPNGAQAMNLVLHKIEDDNAVDSDSVVCITWRSNSTMQAAVEEDTIAQSAIGHVFEVTTHLDTTDATRCHPVSKIVEWPPSWSPEKDVDNIVSVRSASSIATRVTVDDEDAVTQQAIDRVMRETRDLEAMLTPEAEFVSVA